jgi:hypothetical protein
LESKPLETLTHDELTQQLRITIIAMLDAVERKAGRDVIRLYEQEIEKIRSFMQNDPPGSH